MLGRGRGLRGFWVSCLLWKREGWEGGTWCESPASKKAASCDLLDILKMGEIRNECIVLLGMDKGADEVVCCM